MPTTCPLLQTMTLSLPWIMYSILEPAVTLSGSYKHDVDLGQAVDGKGDRTRTMLEIIYIALH
jgi:hypothetical protein